ISLVTNILGSLNPDIASSFGLSKGLVGFIPFSFFIAYGIMSIPSGILNEKYGEKRVLLWASLLSLAGVLILVFFASFTTALLSLFIIGLGVATLQVVINPLLRVAGGDEHFAFNSVLAQLFFGGASAFCPRLYKYLAENIHTEKSNFFLDTLNRVSPEGSLKWLSLYWVFAAVITLLIIILLITRFPKVELNEDEKVGSLAVFRELLQNRYTILFFFGIFSYVGTEQGISYWISNFLEEYHHQSAEQVGSIVTGNFWLYMTIGCLIGLLLLKLFDSRKLLCVFAVLLGISFGTALFGSTTVAIYAFPACGFFASIMWSVVISLGLNSIPRHHGSLAGILCTGIIGGAFMPWFIGLVADFTGLRIAMLLVYVTLGYLFSIGLWAKPLVNNKTF
ncbi:MAG TPA: MFS transporter, partial [Chitinophagaceae bacterium]|nr:MFS transporter [Chitinophagaceae bacterium]